MADRSTKKSLDVLSMKFADELGVPLATDITVILPQNRMDLFMGSVVKKMIEAQERQMAGKGRKHPVTHLFNVQKEKAVVCHMRPAYSLLNLFYRNLFYRNLQIHF